MALLLLCLFFLVRVLQSKIIPTTVTSVPGKITIKILGSTSISTSDGITLSFNLNQPAGTGAPWGSPWLDWQPISGSSSTGPKFEFTNAQSISNLPGGQVITFEYARQPWETTAAATNVVLDLIVPCDPGTYSTTKGGSCKTCPADFYCTGGANIAACYSGTISPAGSSADVNCRCPDGKFNPVSGDPRPITWACKICPPSNYCVGGISIRCPGDTTSLTYGATSCVCSPAYYLNNGACTVCPQNSYCSDQKIEKCPSGSTSKSGTSSILDCVCKSGTFLDYAAATCRPCPAGSYCPGLTQNFAWPCPTSSTSPVGSTSIESCTCLPGSYASSPGGTCQTCPTNSFCTGGLSITRCASNKISAAGSQSSQSCSCVPGYYSSSVDGDCQVCPANSYCTGGTNIQVCSRGHTSPQGSSSASRCSLEACWLRSYGRGAGVPISACPSDREKDGALCYPFCSTGYYGVGPVCWQSCPSGFSNTGAHCLKPGSYGRGAGYTTQSRCASSNSQGCEKNGLLWYPRCAAYFHAVGCCVCSPDCPPEMVDIGVSCQKRSYGRTAGTPLVCAPGLDQGGALCYPQCSSGYNGIGPVCWKGCPSGMSACGALCARDGDKCTSKVLDMANGVFQTVASAYGGEGTSGAVDTAASAGNAATAFNYPVCS